MSPLLPISMVRFQSVRRKLMLGGLAGGVLALVGCNLIPSKPQLERYDLHFELDQRLAGASIQVDIVGPNAINLPNWRSYIINDYWKPNNAMRTGAIKSTLLFGSGKAHVQILSANDPKWSTWFGQGATSLVIIADLPGVFGDKLLDDPRRLILPLDRRSWGSSVTAIRIAIKESELSLQTPMAVNRPSALSLPR